MPPLDRRRRRRPLGTIIVSLVLAALALFLLIGGAAEVGRQSRPYQADIDRSYASQGTVVVNDSNASAAQFDKLVAAMPQMARRQLQEQLDALVADTTEQADDAAGLSPPAPAQGLDRAFAGVMASRALAVSHLRSALDGLLGMAPLPLAGAAPAPTSSSPGAGATSVLLPSDRVASSLSSVGTLLRTADRDYATLRHQFRLAPGSARVPSSVWVHNAQFWSPGPVQTLVASLTASSTLAPLHRLQLLTVRLTPAAVPPIGTPSSSSGAAGTSSGQVSVIPPTDRLVVEAIVADYGNVGETNVVVSAQTQPQGATGTPASASATVSLEPGASIAVALPALKVEPGATYGLTVAVAAPPSQSNRSGLNGVYTVAVGPSGPLTTKGT